MIVDHGKHSTNRKTIVTEAILFFASDCTSGALKIGPELNAEDTGIVYREKRARSVCIHNT